MDKDPAFLFYPGDYLRDTQCLSEKSQVAYDRIMCEHMRNLVISDSQFKFFTKRLSEDEREELLFTLTKVQGGYQITWVAESITKRKAFTESRRKSRLKSDEDNVRIYIVRDNVRLTYKIGSSVNPVRRYAELSNQKAPAVMHDIQGERNITLIWYSQPVLRTEEKRWHKEFKPKHITGEWFKLDESDITKLTSSLPGTYVERTENENENEIDSSLKEVEAKIKELQTNKFFHEDACRAAGVSEPFMLAKLTEFINTKKVGGELNQPINRVKSHFINWLKNDLAKNPPKEKKLFTQQMPL